MPVSILNLRWHHCRFPAGEGDHGMLYCGDPVFKRSYCQRHFRLCYNRPGEMRPLHYAPGKVVENVRVPQREDEPAELVFGGEG